MTARRFLPLVSLVAFLAPGLFAATPIVIPGEGGTVTLPLTGLSVVFPAREKPKLKVTASWSLQVNKNTFDSRDVLDEFGGPENDTIIAGTWAHVGYFNAGGPAAVVLEAELKDAWPVAPATLWGVEWQVRGGKWDFGNDLGIKPALVLAIRQSPEGPSFLLYHFFVSETELTKDEMLARAEASPVMQAVFQAYWKSQYGPSLPTRNPAVKVRNDSVAAREVVLKKTGLRMQLPDDGFVWLVRPASDGSSDFLDRMAPSLPDVSLEVATVDAASVQEIFAMFPGPKSRRDPAPANLPAGWEPGPTIQLENGNWENTVCKLIGAKVLIVGFLVTPRVIDVESYNPVLGALAEALRQAGKPQ
jgi:hypothetical protein